MGSYVIGALRLREARVWGPDALPFGVVDASRRRPSLLDGDNARLHSELHSIVWTVESIEAALPFWRSRAGLLPFLEVTLREPAVGTVLELPVPETPLRLVVLADGECFPARLRLMEFPENKGPAGRGLPLRAGLHAIGFRVARLDQAIAELDGATFGDAVEAESPLTGERRAVRGRAPGGIQFELWETR
jgi:hypothetical protein